jgi:hypothetical protein
MMADREMIAATLAAALLRASSSGGLRTDAAQHAVTIYRQVLQALQESEPATPQPPRS